MEAAPDFDPVAFDAFERTNWERAAPAYSSGFARLSVQTVEPLLDAVRAGLRTRLLDVGCGPGILTRRAVERGCIVSGVDVAEPMLAIARTSVPDAAFNQADVQSGLPYADASFDAVAGNMVVHHLGQPPHAVAHCVRVLAPGGRLGLTMWDPPADNPAQGLFNEAAAAVGASTPTGVPVLRERLDDAYFVELFTVAGLTDVTVKHVRIEFRTDPDEWWDAVVSSTVLTATLVQSQPPEIQSRIRAAYDDLVQRYVDDSGNARFPGSAMLAIGTRQS